jgi:hypothetical protein
LHPSSFKSLLHPNNQFVGPTLQIFYTP